MFDPDELAAGTQDASDLGDGRGWAGDGAEDKAAYDSVDAVGWERQSGSVGVEQRDTV